MRIKYLLNLVELGDEGRASVMFYAPGPWTAKPEYSNSKLSPCKQAKA